jgi:hypothetical protein
LAISTKFERVRLLTHLDIFIEEIQITVLLAKITLLPPDPQVFQEIPHRTKIKEQEDLVLNI